MPTVAFVLVLVYSPVSQYFNGYIYEPMATESECLQVLPQRIGEEFSGGIGNFAWEKEMMGPRPKVIGAYCVKGYWPS